MDGIDEFDFCRAYLKSGEYILWKGKPGKGGLFTIRDLITIPFSLVWLSFALYWEMSVIKTGSSIFAMVWGIPFILIGLYILVGRFFQAARIRKKTFYVITNKKFIIKKKNRIELHNGKDYQLLTVNTHRNGNATLVFGDAGGFSEYHEPHGCFTMENITEIEQVQNAVQAMEQAQEQPSDV